MTVTGADGVPATPPDEATRARAHDTSLASESARRSDIQGLRGLAVLLVVAFHAEFAVPGGFVGVDVFFVISGFVIMTLLLRELDVGDAIDFRHFYTRRIRRLLPALALLLVVVAISAAFFLSPLGTQQQTATLGRAAATFRANLTLYSQKAGYFDLDPNANPLLHTWSLAVEEQFYLVFPAFMLLAWRAGPRMFPSRSRRVVAGAMLGVGVAASLALSTAATAGNDLLGNVARPAQFAFYSAATRAWEFAFGALIALAVPWLRRRARSAGVFAGVAGIVVIVASARLMDAFTPFPGTAALYPVVGATLVLAGGTITSNGAARVLSVRPLVWLGDLSYSWYLWHWPFIVFVAAFWFDPPTVVLVVAAIASLVPSWLSYTYVEQRFRFGRTYTGRRVVVLGGVCVALPLLAMSVLGMVADNEGSSHNARLLRAQLRPHALNGERCVGVVQKTPRRACTASPSGATRGEVWLVGDSQAGQLTEPVARAATSAGFSLTASTFNECPFVDLLLVTRRAGPSNECRRFVRETTRNLVARRPKMLIVASEGSDYVNAAGFRFRDPDTGAVVKESFAKARLWERGLAAVLARFEEANVPVLVVNTIPHFGNWDPRTCPALRIRRDLRSCGVSRDLDTIKREQRAALTAERNATAANGATMVDFTGRLCSPERCETNRGAFFIYMDGHHLSAAGAITLTDDFGRLMRAETGT